MKGFGVLCVLFGATYAATTVDFLSADPNLSTLFSLVSEAGLVSALNSSGNFTIFAPTNAAFKKMPSAKLSALRKDAIALQKVLKYHVVPREIYKHDAHNELKLTTLNGQKIRFNIYHHVHAGYHQIKKKVSLVLTVVTVQGARVTTFDIRASNGVLHCLDDVMMPPEGDIVDLVTKNSQYSTLWRLVQQAGLASALKGESLTLFAPNNAAFTKISSGLAHNITSDKDFLTEILEYHVVPNTEYSTGLFDREKLKTITKHKDRIRVHANSTVTRINNGNVVMADMGTTNGVVHEIDHVLIPRRYRAR